MESAFKIEVLWRSRLAIAVSKPPSLPTQAANEIVSLETVMLRQLGCDPGELWFPHRLDRLVSGVILIALSKRSARLLSQQFSTRKTQKTYEAVVHGSVELPSSTETQWSDYIRKMDGRSKAEPCSEDDPGSKSAVTNVRQIDGGIDAGPQQMTGQSRLELRPITGRMHQLRVQCALRGHPIVGDTLYGGRTITAGTHDQCVVDRILLHARQLGFFDPTTGRWTVVESKCPF